MKTKYYIAVLSIAALFMSGCIYNVFMVRKEKKPIPKTGGTIVLPIVPAETPTAAQPPSPEAKPATAETPSASKWEEKLNELKEAEEPPPATPRHFAPRDYATISWLSPVVLTYADIDKKKDYILSTKKSLKRFLVITRDFRTSRDNVNIEEIGREANSFIEIYVEPIINDPGALSNVETRLETAKLHLLCAMLYHDLAGYNQSKKYLDLIHRRYGKDPAMLDLSIDPMDIGFNTLSAGIQELENKLSAQGVTQ